MNYVEDEIPSENDSANSVKSLKITNLNKLLTDKGRVRDSDVWLTHKHKKNEDFLWPIKHFSHLAIRSENDDNVMKDKVDNKWLMVHTKRPKAWTFKSVRKNDQKCMDSSEILADMWKKLGQNDIAVDDQDNSVSDVECSRMINIRDWAM